MRAKRGAVIVVVTAMMLSATVWFHMQGGNVSELTPHAYYKIVQLTEFDAQNKHDCVALSSLDRASGFIHLSFGRQVVYTLNKFFRHAGPVLAVEVDVRELELYGTQVRVEGNKPGGEPYPHAYGQQKIPLMAVTAVYVCQEQANGLWTMTKKDIA